MEYPEEHSPTKKVIYLVTRRDGSLHRVDGGTVRSEKDLPIPGDGAFLDGIGCRVTGVLTTPHLEETWHVTAEEH